VTCERKKNKYNFEMNKGRKKGTEKESGGRKWRM
jgi:hypothetical protein